MKPGMKHGLVLLAFAAFSAASALADTKKPVAKWSCEEFLAVDDAFQPKVIYWATAQPKSGKPTSLIDIEGTEKVVPMVIDDCKKAPGESFMQKLKGAWKSIEAEAKKLKQKL